MSFRILNNVTPDITACKVDETKAPRRKSNINKLYRKNQNDGEK